MKPPLLTSSRLTLDAFTEDDTDAVLAHVTEEELQRFERFQLALDEVEHATRADLVAAAAADTFSLIEFDGELRRPFGAALGQSGNHAGCPFWAAARRLLASAQAWQAS